MSIELQGIHASIRFEISFEGCDRRIELIEELSREPRVESVGELDRVVLRARASSPALLDSFELEARLGNVTIASTSPEGPAEAHLERIGATELSTKSFTPFSDAAGVSSLEISLRQRGGDESHPAARLEVRVAPEKITPAELDRLMADIESAAGELLFDAYAKTRFGERNPRRARRRHADESIEETRAALEQLELGLARISHRPAQRLTLSPRRVGIYPGEPITPETLLEISQDPSLLTQTRFRVLPRERIEMIAERDVELPEHAAIAGFLTSIGQEIRESLALIRKEIEWRLERRRSFGVGESSIWSQREEPRVRACQALEAKAGTLLSKVRDLRRKFDFLPDDQEPLRGPPELTKRFAHEGAYAGLYRIMREHFAGRSGEFETWIGLAGAKSLPVLWEEWVVLQTLGFLQRRLKFATSPWASPESLFRKLIDTRDRYIIDLSADRRIVFASADGRQIVFRFQPRYHTISRMRQGRRSSIGRLKRTGAPLEPDMAIEVHEQNSAAGAAPEHILLLDAKYSARSHEELIQSVLRYRNIGEQVTGKRLVRQIWVVTCSGARRGEKGEMLPLEACTTVDNECFFEPAFSALGEVCGAVALRPGETRGQSPLDLLLSRVFAVLEIE